MIEYHATIILTRDEKENAIASMFSLERGGVIVVGKKDGNIPPCTVLSSKENGLGIGRSFMRGEVVVGKIDVDKGVLFAPYGRKEYNFTEYDALIEAREQC